MVHGHHYKLTWLESAMKINLKVDPCFLYFKAYMRPQVLHQPKQDSLDRSFNFIRSRYVKVKSIGHAKTSSRVVSDGNRLTKKVVTHSRIKNPQLLPCTELPDFFCLISKMFDMSVAPMYTSPVLRAHTHCR